MGENSTVVSAYTMFRRLQQYCSHLSNNIVLSIRQFFDFQKLILKNMSMEICIHVQIFVVAFVLRQCQFEFNTVF